VEGPDPLATSGDVCGTRDWFQRHVQHILAVASVHNAGGILIAGCVHADVGYVSVVCRAVEHADATFDQCGNDSIGNLFDLIAGHFCCLQMRRRMDGI